MAGALTYLGIQRKQDMLMLLFQFFWLSISLVFEFVVPIVAPRFLYSRLPRRCDGQGIKAASARQCRCKVFQQDWQCSEAISPGAYQGTYDGEYLFEGEWIWRRQTQQQAKQLVQHDLPTAWGSQAEWCIHCFKTPSVWSRSVSPKHVGLQCIWLRIRTSRSSKHRAVVWSTSQEDICPAAILAVETQVAILPSTERFRRILRKPGEGSVGRGPQLWEFLVATSRKKKSSRLWWLQSYDMSHFGWFWYKFDDVLFSNKILVTNIQIDNSCNKGIVTNPCWVLVDFLVVRDQF